jgi:hypothetical protein
VAAVLSGPNWTPPPTITILQKFNACFSCLPLGTYDIPWFHSGYDVEIFNVIFPKYNFIINVNIDLEVKHHIYYIDL